MSYQVIARKWRPQAFDEVVFQDHVSKTLKNSIEKGRISHAYLFSGPRGVGKTTMARILAKALNCEIGPTPQPCSTCDNCREIRSSTSFDVIEIDGASNNSVDDIRELRENVNFAPLKSKYKIYIIDEVHMLSTAAFNALLKTLEEPPPHIIFIFATTEIHKIPDTILSRCQKYFFKKIPVDPIVVHLSRIVEHEGYRISGKALYPIARAAAGSMRDAQSLLDQVISFSDMRKGGDAEIGEEDALSILGIVPVESYIKLLSSIGGTNTAAVMNEVNRVTILGVDIPRFVDGFLDMLRAIRLLRNNISLHEVLGLSDEEMQMVRDTASLFYDEELSRMFRIASELQRDLKYSNNERVNLEMSLLDMIGIKKSPSLASIVNKLEGYSAPSGGAIAGTDKGAAREEYPRTGNKKQDAQVKTIPGTAGHISENNLVREWEAFLHKIQDSRQYLHVILKPASVVLIQDTLHITYPGGADHSYYSRILDDQNLDYIKKELSGQIGKKIQVVVDNAQAGSTGMDESAVKMKNVTEGAAGVKAPIGNIPDDGGSIPLPDAEMLKNPGADEFKSVNPTVERIKNTFHGQIIEKGDK